MRNYHLENKLEVSISLLLPRAHVQGVKQLICLSVETILTPATGIKI